MAIEAIPLTRHIGAEIRGVDLTKPFDEPTRKEVYALWLKHLVLLFRGQELTQEQLVPQQQYCTHQRDADQEFGCHVATEQRCSDKACDRAQ